MKLLEGKVAVVTGAARGIGKAIALKFAQEGANIAFTDLVIDENGLATQAEIEALGVKAKGYASNAANFEETHNVVAEIVKDFGRIDILVNNAGITKDGLMMRMSEGQWDAVLNVNLKSAFNFIHACTPVMMKQRAGSIINMSSVVGVHGNAGQANYSASKAGMIGLAKSVAQELGSRGIRANAIAPGFIITDMTAQLSDEVRAEWCKKIPLRRGGTVEDVANIATFLASDMSSYVSGTVVARNNLGGIAGMIDASSSISGCLAMCDVTGNDDATGIGRICGGGSPDLSSGNYALETAKVNGNLVTTDNNADQRNGADVTKADLTQEFYEELGFDFDNVWKMDPSISDYPVFKWQKAGSTGVKNIDNDTNYIVSATTDGVKVEGLKGNETICIYDVTGMLLNEQIATQGSMTISLNATGICIVNIVSSDATSTFKVAK